jgi:hypothetical protein
MLCFANDNNCKNIGEEALGHECFYQKQNIVNASEEFPAALKVGKGYTDEFEDISIDYGRLSNKALDANLFYKTYHYILDERISTKEKLLYAAILVIFIFIIFILLVIEWKLEKKFGFGKVKCSKCGKTMDLYATLRCHRCWTINKWLFINFMIVALILILIQIFA